MGKTPKWKLPKHIGIILDGNRRWAREVGFDDVCKGHAKGAEKLYEVMEWAFELGINTVTVWVFSTDNTSRAVDEVDGLMALFEKKANDFVHDERVHANRIRVRFIGRIDQLPSSVRTAIKRAEDATKEYDERTLNVAIAYGGREEITDSFKHYLRKECEEKKRPLPEVLDEMEPESIEPHLYMADQPDPDLIIRTSGEIRLSGFLLWQSAYAEYYFCDTFWPAFRHIDFLRAMRAYHRRQRRFGK